MTFEKVEEKVKHLIKPHFRVYFDAVSNKIDNNNYLGGFPYLTDTSTWPGCPTCKSDANFLLQFNKKYGDNLHLIKIFYCQCDSMSPKFFFSKEINPKNKNGLSAKEISKDINLGTVLPQFLMDLDLNWNAPCYNTLKILDEEVFTGVTNELNDFLTKNIPNYSTEDFYEDFRYITDLVPEIGTHTIQGYPEGYVFEQQTICNDCGKNHNLLIQLNGTFLGLNLIQDKTFMVLECECDNNRYKVVLGE